MWVWVLIWLTIAVLGTAWLFLLGREVVRKALRLLEDVEAASARLSGGATTGPDQSGH